MSRVLSWFSCGAASAVATKLAIAEHGVTVLPIYCDTKSEHSDNVRFRQECETWFGRTVEVLSNPKYANHHDVFRKRQFIVGIHGAQCATVLKRELRQAFQKPGDIQIFGFTLDEQERADDFSELNRDIILQYPLIESQLTKEDCLALIRTQGIELPAMYRKGYRNNNCIGCVKGGMGYWNKIRVDFPETFSEMAKIEREIGHSILRRNNLPLYLDELPPDAGRKEPPQDLSCGLTCQIVRQQIEGC